MKPVLQEDVGPIKSGAQAAPIVGTQIDIRWVGLDQLIPVDVKEEPSIGVLLKNLVYIAGYRVVIFVVKGLCVGIGEGAVPGAIGVDKSPGKPRYHDIG